MNERCRIAIVGGGAAGLAAAIFAAEAWDRPDGEASHAPRPPRPAILLLDGARKLGAKILVSGGGRCNVTNETVRAEDFHASSLPFVRQVLAGFDVPATIAWFASLGVELQREEAGKLFPVSQRAATVLEALLARCEALGVSIRTGCRIEEIVPMQRADGEGVRTTAPRFAVRHAGGEIEAHAAILATGGRSLPRTGSDGLGLAIARSLGHTVTPTHPALVPLVLDRSFFHGRLSGLSQVVRLTVLSAGRRIEEREGGLLWTHFGVSGPVVLDASHAWGAAQAVSYTHLTLPT
ncbi:MAG: aminoacetone oxidase family FAD-binding enzyme, partial [Candidatus Eisenbacteria bacterium]|nr:aminoacetone oxidase family FAD-binding enzyme [Candidatus Eisenbacteria bacterium]